MPHDGELRKLVNAGEKEFFVRRKNVDMASRGAHVFLGACRIGVPRRSRDCSGRGGFAANAFSATGESGGYPVYLLLVEVYNGRNYLRYHHDNQFQIINIGDAGVST